MLAEDLTARTAPSGSMARRPPGRLATPGSLEDLPRPLGVADPWRASAWARLAHVASRHLQRGYGQSSPNGARRSARDHGNEATARAATTGILDAKAGMVRSAPAVRRRLPAGDVFGKGAGAVTAAIRFLRVSKSFQQGDRSIPVFNDISLDIEEGSFTTLLGPSGCGKTTLLRMATGLLRPTSGVVFYGGRRLETVNREIGFVTQESKLFPWLTLLGNIELALNIRKIGTRQQRRKKALEWIERVGLAGFEDAYPPQLSGGMQKRASIVRSLIYEPTAVLMDEPFGPLDAQTRAVLQDWLLDLWSQNKMTVLFVTHDLVEAAILSDTVVVLGAKPARINEVLPVNLKRPRDAFDIYTEPGFAPLYERLCSHFKRGLRTKAAATDPSPETDANPVAGRRK